MKKLLLLGGSAQQIIAIETAKRMGYCTVLCDYLSDNPGQYVADKFYLVSTTDKAAVLDIAQKEDVDGIVAYSSDPAAPTAGYVAEKMHLPGIPYDIARCFCEKHLFRDFLEKNGFNVPLSVELKSDSSLESIAKLEYPIIIKPTDSSGSKGVSVIREAAQFEAAKEFALQVSRNGILIAEEFIERDHPDVIEAEIFVVDSEVVVWGLINSIRDGSTNPLLPAAYSYPLNLSPERISLVKKEISRLVKCSHIKCSAFNIEMVISKHDRLYFLDAGPRNGGNMLPEFIGGINRQDMVKATIHAAMGEYDLLHGIELDGQEGGYWGLSVIHSNQTGLFEKVVYSEEAKKCLIREELFMTAGEKVNPFQISRDAVGLAFFCFPTVELRDEVLCDFNGKHISVKTR